MLWFVLVLLVCLLIEFWLVVSFWGLLGVGFGLPQLLGFA